MRRLLLGLAALAGCGSPPHSSPADAGDAGTTADAAADGPQASPEQDLASVPCAGRVGFPDLAAILDTGTDVELGDLDGDGHLDLVYKSAGVVVARGLGDGAFAPPVAVTDTLTGRSLRLADVTGDGALDIVSADGTGTYTIVPNAGSGTFGVVQHYVSPLTEVSFEVAEMTGDARADLVELLDDARIVVTPRTASGFGTGVVSTFAPLMGGGPRPLAMAVGDVTGDGLADVVVQTSVPDKLWVLANDGTGAFPAATVTSYDVAGLNYSIALADLNGDGKLDVVLGGDPVRVLLNTGAGALAAAIQSSLVLPSEVAWIRAADLDADGHTDLVVAGRDLEALRGDGTGHLQATALEPLDPLDPLDVPDAVLGDLDGDGRPELAITHNGSPGFIELHHNTATPTLYDVVHPLGVSGIAPAYWGRLLDVDDDHRPDLVVVGATPGTGALTAAVRLGLGDGTFSSSGPATPIAVEGRWLLADLDNDGRRDLIIHGGEPSQPGKLQTLLVHGTGSLAATGAMPMPANTFMVVAADVDGDGVRDLIADVDPLSMTAHVEVFHGQGDGTFSQVPAVVFTGSSIRGIGAGDFNGDGRADLVIESGYGPTARDLLLGTGGGAFAQPIHTMATGAPGMRLLARDLNGDGKLDLLSVGQYLAVSLGNGDGSFQPPQTNPEPVGTDAGIATIGDAELADVNGDGHLDVVTDGPLRLFSVSLGDGAGRFTTLHFQSTSMVGGVSLGDTDADGRLDALVNNAGVLALVRGHCD